MNDEGRVRLQVALRRRGRGDRSFADDSNRALYRGTLIVHPVRSFWLQGGFSRIPIHSHVSSRAQFDFTGGGFGGPGLDWRHVLARQR